MKKDSTRIEAKLLEIRATEVIYKFFNYQEGPNIIVRKNNLAYVIYPNGQKEVFETKAEPVDSFYNSKSITSKGDTTKSAKYLDKKVGDYIKFNLQAGFVANDKINGVAYIYRRACTYNSKQKVNYTISFGSNLILGGKKNLKHIIGLNYLKTKGEYNYYNVDSEFINNMSGSSTSVTNLHYTSTIQFINIYSGVRFRISRHFSIEPCISYNLITKSDIRKTGTEQNFASDSSYVPAQASLTSIKYFENEQETEKTIHYSISFSPKFSYEFNIKEQKLGIYMTINKGLNYTLNWLMFGITYYPFKKLR